MMDDIHAPTVGSGPVTGGYSNGVPKEQLSLQELMAEKDRLETELKALGQVLDSVSLAVCFRAGAGAELTCAARREHADGPDHLRRLPAQRHRRPPECAPPCLHGKRSLTSGQYEQRARASSG
jgi:hypothetical protein